MISNKSITSYESQDEDDLYQTLQEVSDMTTPRVQSDLSGVSKLIEITRKGKENVSIDQNRSVKEEKTFVTRTEQIEDFFRNFLLKNNLKETLNIFQVEWYEYKSRKKYNESFQ